MNNILSIQNNNLPTERFRNNHLLNTSTITESINKLSIPLPHGDFDHLDHYLGRAGEVLNGVAEVPDGLQMSGSPLWCQATVFKASAAHTIQTIATLNLQKPRDQKTLNLSLNFLHETYRKFKVEFTWAFKQKNPYAKQVIWGSYSQAIKQIIETWVNHLDLLPSNLDSTWKEDLDESSPKLVIVLRALLILHYLNNPSIEFQEPFFSTQIFPLRQQYASLQDHPLLKRELELKLSTQGPIELNEETQTISNREKESRPEMLDLFRKIQELSYPPQDENKHLTNRILQIACEELRNYLPILKTLDQMNLANIKEGDLGQQDRIVFLALMKQETTEQFPTNFLYGGSLKKNLNAAHQSYQALTPEAQKRYDAEFSFTSEQFSKQENPDDDLLKLWAKIEGDWVNPTRLATYPSCRSLVRVAYRKRFQ